MKTPKRTQASRNGVFGCWKGDYKVKTGSYKDRSWKRPFQKMPWHQPRLNLMSALSVYISSPGQSDLVPGADLKPEETLTRITKKVVSISLCSLREGKVDSCLWEIPLYRELKHKGFFHKNGPWKNISKLCMFSSIDLFTVTRKLEATNKLGKKV